LREEFAFEVLFGLNFSRQPTTGLGAIKQKHPEKAGTILRASREFYGHRWFCLWAMAVLVQFSVWNRKKSNPKEKIHLLMLVTGVSLRIKSNQVCGTYYRKPVRRRF